MGQTIFARLDDASRSLLERLDKAEDRELSRCLRRQAAELLAMHAANARTAGIFATQQRWLLAHIALAAHFENVSDGGPGLRASAVKDAAVAHGVASRNTAEAFIKEMIHYGYIVATSNATDKRVRALTVAPFAITAVAGWLLSHLATLDALDGGDRAATFMGRPEMIAAIQPGIAKGLLKSKAIRDPGATFALFTWLNEGGAVMDSLYVAMGEFERGGERVATSVSSLSDFAKSMRLSRGHLMSKLRAAEDLGSLGWTGVRGKSPIWLSTRFVAEYERRQAAELAVIEAAFQQARSNSR